MVELTVETSAATATTTTKNSPPLPPAEERQDQQSKSTGVARRVFSNAYLYILFSKISNTCPVSWHLPFPSFPALSGLNSPRFVYYTTTGKSGQDQGGGCSEEEEESPIGGWGGPAAAQAEYEGGLQGRKACGQRR